MRFVTRQQRLRHNLIADWRGVEDGPLMDSPAVGLDSLIPEILRAWKLDERLHEEELSSVWRETVGDFIAQHTAPDSLKRGVLTVRVLQPTIHHTLMMEKVRLLKRMQERFGKETVREVRFRHG